MESNAVESPHTHLIVDDGQNETPQNAEDAEEVVLTRDSSFFLRQRFCVGEQDLTLHRRPSLGYPMTPGKPVSALGLHIGSS